VGDILAADLERGQVTTRLAGHRCDLGFHWRSLTETTFRLTVRPHEKPSGRRASCGWRCPALQVVSNVAVRLVSCYRYARLTLRAPFLLIVVSSPAAKE